MQRDTLMHDVHPPIPQLKCVGGSAGCSAMTPQVVQCHNRGWDGLDVQWECKVDMDNSYRFGKVEVSCEGFDYPDDPHVLRAAHVVWNTHWNLQKKDERNLSMATVLVALAQGTQKAGMDSHPTMGAQ
ncbi:unnamed protein product [Staurois parvus]|uniref:Store-operated calcium entry-associated regulatory factor n=1 Tax=Staurois parvus TaxID=386267 RepID=A0ABN9CFS7_9NEOB|nr:unnamed protein product [Staurois parvus]